VCQESEYELTISSTQGLTGLKIKMSAGSMFSSKAQMSLSDSSVVGRIQFLEVVELKSSVSIGCPPFHATGSSLQHSLLVQSQQESASAASCLM
jgi:hypothetical protein